MFTRWFATETLVISIFRFTLEGMLTEFNALKTNVQRLKSQLDNVDQEVKDQFSSFLEVSLCRIFHSNILK